MIKILTDKERAFLIDLKEVLQKHDVSINAMSDENADGYAWLDITFFKQSSAGYRDPDYSHGWDKIEDGIDASDIDKMLK